MKIDVKDTEHFTPIFYFSIKEYLEVAQNFQLFVALQVFPDGQTILQWRCNAVMHSFVGENFFVEVKEVFICYYSFLFNCIAKAKIFLENLKSIICILSLNLSI